MVNCWCCIYCENYKTCCNYKCKNTFNYGLFNHFICIQRNTSKFFEGNREGPCICCEFIFAIFIALPILFVIDLIIYPFHCCFVFFKFCECKKINTSTNSHTNTNVIIEIAPNYIEHYGHSRVIQEITTPPSYQV